MAQRTEADLRELTNLVKGLGTKIEDLDKTIQALDRKTEKGFVEVDKKIEKGFSDADKKIDALDKQVGIGFADINGKLDVINTRLATSEAAIVKLDTRLWAFGGVALSVTIGSLLTVFVRYIFTDSPKF